MKLKRVFAFVGLSFLVVSAGCAKKKELPPRGNLIGKAEFAPHLQYQLQSALEIDGKLLDLSGQCMQMVERNDGMKVVELSDAGCPASGLVDPLSIIATMKVYSETEPGESTYLVMGSSTVLDQNTDVAILKNITRADSKTPQYEIESLCQDTEREELSKNCQIEYTDTDGMGSKVKGVRYKKSRPANLVRRHQIHELYAADESIRSDMQKMDIALRKKIEKVRSTLDAKMDAMDERLKKEDKRIDTKLDDAVLALSIEDFLLSGDIASVRNDLTAAIKEEATTRSIDDAMLALLITDLNTQLTNFKKSEGEANLELDQKFQKQVSDLMTDLSGLGDELRKADKKISRSVRNLRKELGRLAALETTSKEAKEAIAAIQKELGRLTALENKDKMLDGMIDTLKNRVDTLVKPDPEKPEAPPLPESEDESQIEKP